MNIYQEKVERIFNECDKHTLRIQESYSQMLKFMPLDSKNYQDLSSAKVQVMDQFMFRFAKLQDAMGRKLFRAILAFKGDDRGEIEFLPFIDILNRLEKFEIIPSAQAWRSLRDIRNELAHQYDDKPEEMVSSINKIYEKKNEIISVYNNVKNYYLSIKR